MLTFHLFSLLKIPHSWPWIASLAFFGPKSSLPHACGAALINRRHLITATHCVLKSTIFSLVGSPVANSTKYATIEKMMRVYIGVHRRSSDISPENTFYAEKILSVSSLSLSLSRFNIVLSYLFYFF